MSTYALITGASKGIGKFIAVELAKKGYNLLLVARSKQQLMEVSVQLRDQYSIEVNFFVADLTQSESLSKIMDWIQVNKFSISVLVNNAGFGLYGEFADTDLAEIQNMVNLNILALTSFTHVMIPLLKEHKKAYVLHVASTAAFQAMPYMSTYAASKAYVLSFSRALRYELKSQHISVSCLCPGPVDTYFWERAKAPSLKSINSMSKQPQAVAKIAVDGLFDEKAEIIAGKINWLGAFSNRFLPKFLVEKVVATMFR